MDVGLSTAPGFLCCLGCFGAFVMVKSCWTASLASLEKGARRPLAFAFEVYVGVCVSCCLLYLIILTTDKLENHSKHPETSLIFDPRIIFLRKV